MYTSTPRLIAVPLKNARCTWGSHMTGASGASLDGVSSSCVSSSLISRSRIFWFISSARAIGSAGPSSPVRTLWRRGIKRRSLSLVRIRGAVALRGYFPSLLACRLQRNLVLPPTMQGTLHPWRPLDTSFDARGDCAITDYTILSRNVHISL
jgi:hypothetical protein